MKIYRLGEVDRNEILRRDIVEEKTLDSVRAIIDNVRKNGDSALREYTEKFDGVDISSFRVTEDEMKEALASVDSAFLSVLKKAKERIYDYHRRQKSRRRGTHAPAQDQEDRGKSTALLA